MTCRRRISGIEDQAAVWLARRQAGLTPVDEEALSAWLNSSPEHRAVFHELEAALSMLRFPAESGQAREVRRQLAMRAGRRRTRLRAAIAGAGIAAAILIAALGPNQGPLPVAPPHASAPAVAVRSMPQVLPDGSRVELNAGAEIAVDFSESVRAVRLLHGQAMFSVEKDSVRPFVVTAGPVSVRAVGTAFSVGHGAEAVDVIVTEGKVSVERLRVDPSLNAVAPAILVVAGGRVEVPVDPAREATIAPLPLTTAELKSALAWRGRWLEFTRTTLATAATLFNEENRIRLVIIEPALAGIEITGIFSADDPEGFVRLIESGFDVRSRRDGDTIELRGR